MPAAGFFVGTYWLPRVTSTAQPTIFWHMRPLGCEKHPSTCVHDRRVIVHGASCIQPRCNAHRVQPRPLPIGGGCAPRLLLCVGPTIDLHGLHHVVAVELHFLQHQARSVIVSAGLRLCNHSTAEHRLPVLPCTTCSSTAQSFGTAQKVNLYAPAADLTESAPQRG